MLLTFDQIKKITCGAVNITQEPEGIVFHRFTQEQYDLYEKKNTVFFRKAKGTAGVKLSFRTDSKNLGLKLTMKHIFRQYLALDVYVNDILIGSINNYSHQKMPEEYASIKLPLGDFEGQFSLGEGE